MSTVFEFSDEQREFRDMLRRFVDANSTEAMVRERMIEERGFDPVVWTEMAKQLGLQGLIVPEAYGGQGFGPVELAIVLEEMGAALFCAPYFSSAVLAVNTLLLAGDEGAARDLLPGIASGELLVTLAASEADGRWDPPSVQMTATHAATHAASCVGDRFRLTGEKYYVLDGQVADVLLVAARSEAGVSVFRVAGDASGLTRRSVPTLDPTRKLARIRFDDVEATLVGEAGGGVPILSRVVDRAIVALAAEQVGGSQRCLDRSVEYAQDRYQFGRPIGSFQAIKHKCADMLLEVESARSAAYYASFAAADGDAELGSLAPLAKACCSEAFLHVAAENIQIHGGIGFTWDHAAHLYYRRAKSSDLMFGDAAHQRERLAGCIFTERLTER